MKKELENYYIKLNRGVELLNKGIFNSLFILGPHGTGKSYVVDEKLNELKVDYRIFKGEVSEAKWFEFLQDNSNKTIVLRDVGRLLRRLSFIDSLKAITEPIEERVLERLTYAKHEGVSEEITFKGSIIFELNSVPKRYSEDLKALFSRGLFIELNFSIEDLFNIMNHIANSKEKKEVVAYLYHNLNKIGINSFNLRTQNLITKIREEAEKEKKDWKQEAEIFLENELPESRKLLYRFAGFNPVKRIEFIKFLIRHLGISYATAQRKVNEALYLGDIFSNNLQKQALLSLVQKNVSNVSHHNGLEKLKLERKKGITEGIKSA